MGSAVFDVGEILGSRGNTQAKKLKKGGSLIATVQKSEGSGTFHFQFKAEKLKNTEGMFSKSDPFFVLSRKVSVVAGCTWDQVYRSDYIKNNLNPEWKEDHVELSVLCGGDLNAPINLAVYDWEKSGKHVPMGSIETTVSNLAEAGAMSLWKKGKQTGTLVITNSYYSAITTQGSTAPTAQLAGLNIHQTPVVTANGASNGAYVPMPPPKASAPPSSFATGATSAGVAVGAFVPMAPPGANPAYKRASSNKELFVDYISGGCELNVVVAIDFTGSNGDPRKPGTLHHIDSYSRNNYEQAISAISSILLQYDSDKKIPVLGFGAKYGGVVRHCFQCGAAPEADGLQGVMDAYHSIFSSGLILSRPTVFNEVLETSAEKAEASQKAAMRKGGQSYTILLIVTDGAVSDVQSTADCLSRISTSPLSVVIVGVGDADFTAMQFLDDSAIQTGKRDIAQFVPFNQHSHSSQSLTQATLEEVPQQLVEYFQSKGLKPLPPVVRDGDSLANLVANQAAEDEIDLSLDIGEDEIVVTGGGMNYVDGFNARR